jgi:hypothetical protein
MNEGYRRADIFQYDFETPGSSVRPVLDSFREPASALRKVIPPLAAEA